MKKQFNCRYCGKYITTKEFEDKVAERCENCGIIWEVKLDGNVELEFLQLVGGKFMEDDGNVCTGFGGGRHTKSVFPEILKENEEALNVWNSKK